MVSARGCLSEKQRKISFPVIVVRLGLFSLRNDPTTHASEIMLIFNSIKSKYLSLRMQIFLQT